jgi:hypothetical protein
MVEGKSGQKRGLFQKSWMLIQTNITLPKKIGSKIEKTNQFGQKIWLGWVKIWTALTKSHLASLINKGPVTV